MIAYYNDNEPYCCDVLRARIADGSLPVGDVDRRDIRTVEPNELRGYRHIHLFAGIGGFPLGLKWAGWPDWLSVLSGGFPCQDISSAGTKLGLAGKRSNLWSEQFRMVRALRPDFVFVENAAALLSRGMGQVMGDLAGIGYDAEWSVVSCCAMGAPHMRRRVYIVAHPNGLDGWPRLWNPDAQQKRTLSPIDRLTSARACWNAWLENPSELYRGADGVSSAMDRNRAIGNSVSPQVVEVIARAVLEAEKSGLQAEAETG